MADEDPWGTDDTEEAPAAPTPKAATPKTAKGSASKGGTPAKGSKTGTPSKQETPTSKAGTPAPGSEELPEAEVPPQDDPNHRRPITLYKHWVRYALHKRFYLYKRGSILQH